MRFHAIYYELKEKKWFHAKMFKINATVVKILDRIFYIYYFINVSILFEMDFYKVSLIDANFLNDVKETFHKYSLKHSHIHESLG